MTLKLEEDMAICPLGKFRVFSQGHYCFEDRASEHCLNCLYGDYEKGPNLFDVCKSPDDKTKAELANIIEEYKKTNEKFAPIPFQKFLKEKGYII